MTENNRWQAGSVTYDVDRNVPVAKTRSQTRVYPWFQMQVGDSFFVPLDVDGTEDSGAVGVKNLRASIYNSGRHALTSRGLHRQDGYTVLMRKLSEGGRVGLRAWLVCETTDRIPGGDDPGS
jgi:hypothetical protein